MNIQQYMKPKTFLEVAREAGVMVHVLSTDKLRDLKKDIKAKVDYLKKQALLANSKNECNQMAETLCDLLTAICVEEKLAFKPQHGNRYKKSLETSGKEVSKNEKRKAEKERHYLKSINSQKEADAVVKEIKEKRGIKTVTPAVIHAFTTSRSSNHRKVAEISHPEYYTPPHIIEIARKTMGGIDLDPASNPFANKIVKAKKYYTEKDNGLKQRWRGNVWLNPPYTQKVINEFIHKLATETYKQAIVLVNNSLETRWGQELLSLSGALCIIRGRVKFYGRGGEHKSGPLQGQVIIGIKVDKQRFVKYFKDIGVCFVGA